MKLADMKVSCLEYSGNKFDEGKASFKEYARIA